jgi:hypothetical protein
MARSRCTLNVDHVPAFSEWLRGKGYTVEAAQACHEVIRVRGTGWCEVVYIKDKTHRGHTPTHCTVYGKVLVLAQQFYAQKRKREDGIE